MGLFSEDVELKVKNLGVSLGASGFRGFGCGRFLGKGFKAKLQESQIKAKC